MAKLEFGDGMYLRVLGCGSSMPRPYHNHSAQMLRLGEKVFLIDCGEGTQLQMVRFGVAWSNLHRIFITHLHGDHCLGLPGLLSSMAMSGLDHPVHVYGPKGIKEYILAPEPFAPQRAKGSGARMYTRDDLELVGKIRYLLQEKGLSLAAVNAQLRAKQVHTELEIRERLFEIRDKVQRLKEMVEQQLGRE